jgi:hypothetical protein
MGIVWKKGGNAALQQLLASTASVTTDMGTELGLAGALKGDFWAWFQESVQPSAMECDTGACDIDSPYMFARALPVAGILHTIDNLTHDIHLRAMSFWCIFVQILGSHLQPFLREVDP